MLTTELTSVCGHGKEAIQRFVRPPGTVHRIMLVHQSVYAFNKPIQSLVMLETS